MKKNNNNKLITNNRRPPKYTRPIYYNDIYMRSIHEYNNIIITHYIRRLSAPIYARISRVLNNAVRATSIRASMTRVVNIYYMV
jgi:hypothetical protein